MNIDEIIRQRLKERGYFIQNTLGIGGFGITYLAIDQMNQKSCVIKTLKPEFIQESKLDFLKLEKLDNYVQLFRNEAGVLLRYKHPSIVQIYGILSELLELYISNSENHTYKLELPFLVMEYIEGENLKELVSRQNSFLPEVEALHYIQQIGEALCAIHNVRLLHRDIKPQNIMVRTVTNEAVLIDFGIARDFLPDVTQSHTVSFTPCYAPPEQRLRRDKRGNYTDIYGLAATLYYLLTKQPPIDADERQRGEPLKELQKINPNISDRVKQAILWGMELEPRKRPQTVQEWLTELLSSEIATESKLSQDVPTQYSILEPAPFDSERVLKLRVHRARFTMSLIEYYFINATNFSLNRPIELTHVWYEDKGYYIPIHQPSRPLPVRLEIDQSWETWIEVTKIPQATRDTIYQNFRARISTGTTFRSEAHPNVPAFGQVPGGPIQRIPDRTIDYTRLRNLLAAGNWEDADYETLVIMLKVVGREDDNWIREEELLNFPCTDLHTIDQLWVKYSNGRFGFSVQKKIYLEVGGIPNGNKRKGTWEKFGDRVGWRKGWIFFKDWIMYSEVTLDTSAPQGHLPTRWISSLTYEHYLFSSLASRLVNCNI